MQQTSSKSVCGQVLAPIPTPSPQKQWNSDFCIKNLKCQQCKIATGEFQEIKSKQLLQKQKHFFLKWVCCWSCCQQQLLPTWKHPVFEFARQNSRRCIWELLQELGHFTVCFWLCLHLQIKATSQAYPNRAKLAKKVTDAPLPWQNPCYVRSQQQNENNNMQSFGSDCQGLICLMQLLPEHCWH